MFNFLSPFKSQSLNLISKTIHPKLISFTNNQQEDLEGEYRSVLRHGHRGERRGAAKGRSQGTVGVQIGIYGYIGLAFYGGGGVIGVIFGLNTCSSTGLYGG